jgi:GNAT superfamily N-acetyltransferase
VRAATLRRARPADTDAILDLNRVGNGEDILDEMAVAFAHGAMAPEDYAVAEVDGRVVATVGLLATSLRLGLVRFPVGQPEYIATAPEFQGHGLARRLLALVEEWSEARGDLAQIITGVPYFYRQYGYSYGLLRAPDLVVPPERALAMPAGDWEVRPASAGDVEQIRRLQDAVQSHVDLALPFAETLWPAFLAMPAAPLLVAVSHGTVGGVARLRLVPGSPVHVQALAADGTDGFQAVLAATRAGHPGATLIVADREGSMIRSVVGYRDGPGHRRRSLYSRVPSLARLLTALTPVLDDRLARSAFASYDGSLDISLYRSSVRLRFERGGVSEVTAGAAIHEPDEVGAVGIAPDLVPHLIFGEGGVRGIEDHPDVYLGRFQPLMAVLFPPLRVDLLTW